MDEPCYIRYNGVTFIEIFTIQKSVSLAKLEYDSIVERTLNIRQTSTNINLQVKHKQFSDEKR